MSEVGVQGVVSLPNFGHWYHVWSLLSGHMPLSKELPYQWFDTPNLHMTTVADFEAFLGSLDISIVGRAFLADGSVVRALPRLRATQAIYRFRRQSTPLPANLVKRNSP